ncbi:MAG: DUF1289 domain-containing protein [Paracoccaceae bacterium]|nr:DUF1289 domain-containing protein [Paracoccaceae bacterium]
MNNQISLSTDDIWKRDEIESPCVKLCIIHPVEKVCSGCYRTLDEIGRWSQMSPKERTTIMSELPGRAIVPNKRHGGRSGRLAHK